MQTTSTQCSQSEKVFVTHFRGSPCHVGEMLKVHILAPEGLEHMIHMSLRLDESLVWLLLSPVPPHSFGERYGRQLDFGAKENTNMHQVMTQWSWFRSFFLSL